MLFRVCLDLHQHCIATEIKRRYNKALSTCLSRHTSETMCEQEIELLKHALETLDFQALRATYSELAGQSQARVVLGHDTDDGLCLTIDERSVDLIYRQLRY